MGIPNKKFYLANNPAASAASDTTITTEYRAPNLGLEDQVFTFGKEKDATKLAIAKEEMDKKFHLDLEQWS